MSESRNTVARMPTQAESKPLRACTSLDEAFKSEEFLERIKESNALVRNMDERRVLQGVIQAANKQPLIYKCDFRQSVGAILSLVWMGLIPGTIMGHAHLIPFARRRKGEVVGYDLNVIIGYQGYLELATRADAITSVHCDADLEGDHFEYEFGTNKFLHHSYGKERDYEHPRHSYAWVKMKDGDDQFEVMPWADVLKIRNRSQAYRTALSAREDAEKKGWRIPSTWTDAPWVRDELEMGKKTAFRRLAKWLPKCPTLRVAAAIEDAQEYGHGVDYGPIIDGATVESGISPREREPDEDADPGAAHTDRRAQEPPKVEEPTQPRTRRRAQDNKPDPKSESPKDTVAPSLELRMIDEFGQAIETTTFSSYVSFVTMLSSRWHRLEDDPKLRAALVEFNADTIAEAEQDGDPRVLEMLKQLHEEPPPPIETPPLPDSIEPPESVTDWGDSEDDPTRQSLVAVEEPMAYVPLYPITERGKQQWGVWVNEMKDEAGTIASTDLPGWLEVQKPVIDEAPQSSLLAVVRHVCAAFAKHGLMPPSWLVEKVGAQKKPEPQPAKQPEEPRAISKERKYANDRLADLAEVEDTLDGRYTFERLIALMKSNMMRLRESHPDLYDEIRVAYEEKSRKLPKLPGEKP